MNREDFETMLDAGKLQTRIQRNNGENWHDVRRGGKTRTWKRDPTRFEIPIRYSTNYICHMRVTEHHFTQNTVAEWFRIKPENSVAP
jgi:hypothetical protein